MEEHKDDPPTEEELKKAKDKSDKEKEAKS